MSQRRRRPIPSSALPGLLLLIITSSGCLSDLIKGLVHVEPADAEPGLADAGPFEGPAPEHLTLDSIKPDRGPFVGGTEVVIYGFGFTAKTTVTIGGRAPEQDSFRVLSPVALELVTPAGEVGPAEVVIDNGTEVVRKVDGFTYDPLALQPSSGPTAGGTLVNVLGLGTYFEPGLELSLGGKPLTEIEVLSSTLLRAKTPPGDEGPADLSWSQNGVSRVVGSAFTYYASANPKSGGLGGGPLDGTLTVTVLNVMNRKPLPGAQVLVQQERLFQAQAPTDANGTVVFSAPDLKGPVSVSAALPEFETSTLVAFDARDVTVFLYPIPKEQPGPLPPGTLGAWLEGYLLFGGPTGTGSPYWKLVPEPKAGQSKRAYVFVSAPSLDWGPQLPSPQATIDWSDSGATAWPYGLPTRSGVQAVYAVAGLYTQASGQFDPYAMGVRRGVVVGPGEFARADVSIEIPLVETVRVELKDLPTELAKHRLRLAIGLGADGYLMRPDQEAAGSGLLQEHVFSRLPGFAHQTLLDATYTVDLRLESATASGLPVVRATERSVRPSADGMISLAGFLAPPQQVKPAPGSPLVGNTLAWSYAGGGTPDLAVTSIQLSDGTPVWRVISRGDLTTVKLPDPVGLGLDGWPAGQLVWSQWLAHLPGFDFDTFNYSHLSSGTWDRWSSDQFQLQVP